MLRPILYRREKDNHGKTQPTVAETSGKNPESEKEALGWRVQSPQSLPIRPCNYVWMKNGRG